MYNRNENKKRKQTGRVRFVKKAEGDAYENFFSL